MIHDPPLPAPFAERFAPLTEVKFSGPPSSVPLLGRGAAPAGA
ncbi:MAG: hypothetical protein WEG40_23060 [Candidatus Rokuibacteriota bacterium]